MADLVAIAFPTEAKAEEVREKLLNMQKEYLIELADAVIAVKQPDGTVKLNQLFHPTAAGAATGGFWGLLIGLIFLMPLAGAAIGAASGALGGALSDVGINDQFMKDAAQALQSGNAALFLLDPQDHGRQGAGRSQRCRRHGDAHLVRSHERRGAARSACRGRPAAAPALDGARLRPVQNAVQT